MSFTEEEIRNFPIELKVCFYLLGWENYEKINNVDDWIEFAWYYYANNSADYLPTPTEEKAKSWAREDYNRLYDFIIRYIR